MRFILLSMCLCACATVPRPLLVSHPATDAAQAAAETFYSAQTPAQMREAAKAVWAAAPESALAHEVAAALAELDGNVDLRFSHLCGALTDTADDDPLLHLHALNAVSWTEAQRPVGLALLRTLVDSHPNPDVRSLAAYVATFHLGQKGELEERAQMLARVEGRLKVAIVGTWDNDQGKALDQELAPETRPALTERYEGRSHPLVWRTDVPVDPRGRIDLGSLVQPTRWMAAFAQSTFVAEADDVYSLQLTSSDPLKVWVDGKLAFSSATVFDSVQDNVVLPLRLTRGLHTVLVKSAQREGTWLYSIRATRSPTETAGAVKDAQSLLRWRIRSLPLQSKSRALAHLVQWAQTSLGGLNAVQAADAWSAVQPKSLVARIALVDALWFNQERGRTADLLAALDAEVGSQLAFVRLREMRFLTQQGLKTRAREQLTAFTRAHPGVKDGWRQLADLSESEGWSEDDLNLERYIVEHFSPTASDRVELISSLMRDGKRGEAKQLLLAQYAEIPGQLDVIRKLTDLALDEADYAEAERLQRWRLSVWPIDVASWVSLAETRRRHRDYAGADAALKSALLLNPDASYAVAARAALRYEQGDTRQAVALWRDALALNPDDEKLANRLDYLQPEARLPWLDDVPDETKLLAAVAQRTGVQARAGADLAYLLDHEVSQLNNDGSSNSVITQVVVALDPAGRDRLTRQALAAGGRVRVLSAWALDPQGVRTEASDERSRQIFFRNLQVGSTVVLQYRVDLPATGFLSRYLTKAWNFQGLTDQRRRTELVLWAPLGTKLHERTIGEVKRTEVVKGNQLRIAWAANDTVPLVYEAGMPTVNELAANVRISSVPDWDTWLSWERALLEGAFRISPELEQVAAKLDEGSPDNTEKVRRVHQFVMQEIRYQQDYESFIAGVRPHAAPMVLERKYGDCKDKAVLFITLAKQLGLSAQFALVRTRDAGPLDVDVPMQQFNHAIVYVPQQPGIAEGRFFDPTADMLDIDSLRSDDPGTRTLVFDPETMQNAWRDIPYQGAEKNSETSLLKLQMQADGSVKGSFEFSAVGSRGSMVRRNARNTETFAQLLQRDASALVTSAVTDQLQLDEVKDLNVPARVSMQLSARSASRVEGETVRFRLPTDWSPRAMFSLSSRRHPLLFGAPFEYVTRSELTLPEGFLVSRTPASGSIDNPCLSYSRVIAPDGNKLLVEQRVRFLCERISAAEYQKYREQAESIRQMLDDELVLTAAPKAKPKVKQATR